MTKELHLGDNEEALAASEVRFALVGEIENRLHYFPLEGGANSIGSDRSNGICLGLEGVSRRHAIVLCEGSRFELIDQSSKNGTFVDRQRIRRSLVDVGSRIEIGSVELTLEAVDADDVELAIQVADTASAHETAIVGTPDTQDLQGSSQSAAKSWVRVLRLFLTQMQDAPTPGAEVELLQVINALGVHGACILELPVVGGPILAAAWGGISGDLIKTVVRSWESREGSDLYQSDPELTFYLCPSDDRGVGVVLAGDVEGWAEKQPLLMALTAVYQLARHGHPTTPIENLKCQDKGALRFPPKYIRGVAAATIEMYDEMSRLAGSEFPVLICGETGVGKELIARSLHLSSARKDSPFVAVNCAAIPVDLLEAELFGIAKAVATGVSSREGLFAKARGGTLLLDEIGEMPIELQAKLLRALQEKEVKPVGGTAFPSDVRILAATNIEIDAQKVVTSLRPDLFYRLAAALVRVPPLRERHADIPILIERFLRRFSDESGKGIRGITVAAQRSLTRYEWPGNVRELEHEIQRLVFACPEGQAISTRLLSDRIAKVSDQESGELSAEHAVSERQVDLGSGSLPTLRLEDLERIAIEEALNKVGGRRKEAAELLGLSRFALMRRLKRIQA